MEKYKYCITPTSSLEYTITLCVILELSWLQRNGDAITLSYLVFASVQCQCTYLAYCPHYPMTWFPASTAFS